MGAMTDYVHDRTQALEERVWILQEAKTAADLEVAYAEDLNVDLLGPITAAKRHSDQCAEEIAELKAIIERVSAGYPYWEREGFEAGIDAIGSVGNWEPLSEIPARGLVVGNDDARIRLPIEVQYAYQRALASRLFESFTICCQFEPDYDAEFGPQPGPGQYYLFGVLGARFVEPDGALFLVAQWDLTWWDSRPSSPGR
jgi:hypothetical protein